MKKCEGQQHPRAKTDKLDSIMIANYGIEKWFKLQRYEGDEEIYAELSFWDADIGTIWSHVKACRS